MIGLELAGQAGEIDENSAYKGSAAVLLEKETLGRWEDGRIILDLKSGLKGSLQVYFEGPIIRRVAEIIPLAGAIMIFLHCRRK